MTHLIERGRSQRTEILKDGSLSPGLGRPMPLVQKQTSAGQNLAAVMHPQSFETAPWFKATDLTTCDRSNPEPPHRKTLRPTLVKSDHSRQHGCGRKSPRQARQGHQSPRPYRYANNAQERDCTQMLIVFTRLARWCDPGQSRVHGRH
jgi:hypothetical protein